MSPTASEELMATTPAQPAGEAQESKEEAPFCILHPDGSIDPDLDPKLSDETLVSMYEHMLQGRIIDDRLTRLQRQGRIGFHIGPPGEEASIVGPVMALQDQDWFIPSYREFPALFVRGVPLQSYVDNMFGNAGDPVKGRQMPDHWCDAERRIGSVSSPVGTQIPQAVGIAWASRLKKEDAVAVVYFGDGTASQGDFHVGANFAGVFDAPCILMCRNNQWAISTPFDAQSGSATIAERAIAYGIEGRRVDGNDVLAMYVATREAAEKARSGGGAVLLEAVTYRLGAHSTSDDPKAYRDESEVEPWRDREPLTRMRRLLESKGLWDDAQEESFTKALNEELRSAIERAEKTPLPSIESMFDEVYASPPWHLKEQLDELKDSLQEG